MRRSKHGEVICQQLYERQDAALGLKYRQPASSIHLITLMPLCLVGHWSGSLQPTTEPLAWNSTSHLGKESLPTPSGDQQPLPQKGHKLLLCEFPALHLVGAFAIHPTEQVCFSGFCKKPTLKVTYHLKHFDITVLSLRHLQHHLGG